MSYPNSNSNSTINAYQQVGAQTAVASASPHRLIHLLMTGAVDKIAVAKGHMMRGNIPEKGRHISWAISIINGLAASLDMEKGGELASNLGRLYEYMGNRLLEANLKNKPEYLDEVAVLMNNIKAGWDAIPDEHRS